MTTTMTTEISSDYFARRYQFPSPYTSPYTSPYPAIPNQLHSTPSSSDSDSDSDEGAEKKEGIRSNLELEDYMNDSTLSVDGEFDVRIDIIGVRPLAASTSSSPLAFATAPPLSDYESDHVVQHKILETIKTTTTMITPHKADASKQETYKETCIICYEDIADVTDVVTEEGEINITDFCRTCKYTVHLDCIDEYRVNKLNDAVAERDGESIASSSVGIKCLMCALEVERIYVKRNGDINIVKTQIERSNAHERGQQQFPPEQRLSPEQRLQRDLHAQVLNNMERRMRRERRNRFRQKCCNFCFFTILAMSIAVIVIMRFA